MVIDGITLRDFDFVDIGRIRLPSGMVPVTIKSLLFDVHEQASSQQTGAVARSKLDHPKRSSMEARDVEEGTPAPLGATLTRFGVNFALFSDHATAVDLCLFDATGRRELHRIRMPRRTDDVWHVYVRGLRPGQLYGYRVHGPYEPQNGHPLQRQQAAGRPVCARDLRRVRWHDALLGYRPGASRGDLSFDRRDSAPMRPNASSPILRKRGATTGHRVIPGMKLSSTKRM